MKARAGILARKSDVIYDLFNAAKHSPVQPGGTLSPKSMGECSKRGWVRRNSQDDWVITTKGRLFYWAILPFNWAYDAWRKL